ncbi:MAG TPA: aminotransferase class I/II-fold pyridoxal phosphate-dependent enzyme, partial [Terriglobia bacterium]|nr:aminotransferase class I/II-fold pyridoxal phosphate-dependent enzyme [Terriglobia bacterium]
MMRLIKGMQFVLADDAHGDQPLYRRIYLRLREAIEDGVLTAGTRLPSTRTLAQDLKVSRNTIAAAFDQLHADGYLNQRVGDGTYVAPLPPGKRRHPVPDSGSADPANLAEDAAASGRNTGALDDARADPTRANAMRADAMRADATMPAPQSAGGRIARGRRAPQMRGNTGGKSGPHTDGLAKPLSPASALPQSLTAPGLAAQSGNAQPGFSQRGTAFDPAGLVAAAMEPVCMLARPGVDLFPRGQWRQVMNEVINSRRADGFDVCDPAGHPDLRRAVARHLAISRGLICDASQVIITTSGLQSVDLAIRVISDPGDQVWMEDPGCTETRATMLSAGLE